MSDIREVTFPDGLFGFEQYKKYAITDSEYVPFLRLQSLEDSGLSFLIVDPFAIFSTYEADIDDESLAKIDVKSPDDIVVMVIVTVPSDGSEITANLQGPLIVNKRNRLCAQVILSDSRWRTKHSIREALSSGAPNGTGSSPEKGGPSC